MLYCIQNIKKIVSYVKIKGRSDYPNLRFVCHCISNVCFSAEILLCVLAYKFVL